MAVGPSGYRHKPRDTAGYGVIEAGHDLRRGLGLARFAVATRRRFTRHRGLVSAHAARLLLSTALLAALPVEPVMAAGSWVADANTPTLRQRGWRYETRTLEPRASTPLAGRAITSVSWRFGFDNSGRPPRVALCAGSRCIKASTPTGRSTAFAGLAPATAFRFVFVIPGRGMLDAPRRGGPLQLVVNFD